MAADGPTRIRWISPVGRDDALDEVRAILEAASRPDTEVDVACLERGPRHVEYRYYESLVLPDTLHLVRESEVDGFDAAVLGCFYDLGVEAAREVTSTMAVTGPAEATTHLAATLGDRFSIVVGRRKWVPQMRERVRGLGHGDHLASFKPVDLGVLDFQADPERTERRLTAAAREAVEEDGAEVVILGCTAEYGFYGELQERLGVPVLDAVTTPLKFAELLAELRAFGWHASEVGGYEPPPREEIERWELPETYGADPAVWGLED